jgi:hypothetical protein
LWIEVTSGGWRRVIDRDVELIERYIRAQYGQTVGWQADAGGSAHG